MATKSLLQLVPIAVCLLLIILPAAHGQEEQARVFLCGIARCMNDPSKIIPDATLEVSINGTTLMTGKTTATGQILLAANVPSTNLLTAFMSNEAIITGPPHSCGGGGSGSARDYVILLGGVEAALKVKTIIDNLSVYSLAYDFMNAINALLNI